MKTESTGVGVRPDPRRSEGTKAGQRERLEQFSLRIPYRAKLALVWLAIFLILAVIFGCGAVRHGLDARQLDLHRQGHLGHDLHLGDRDHRAP